MFVQPTEDLHVSVYIKEIIILETILFINTEFVQSVGKTVLVKQLEKVLSILETGIIPVLSISCLRKNNKFNWF